MSFENEAADVHSGTWKFSVGAHDKKCESSTKQETTSFTTATVNDAAMPDEVLV